MPIYKASLERFETILAVHSLNATPGILIALPTDTDEIKHQLERLKTAIEATTRYITDLYVCMHDGSLITDSGNETLLDMYATHVGIPLQNKITKQLDLEEAIKVVPYGPYFDFFRMPGAPHDRAGEPFPPSEIEGLEEVSASLLGSPTVHVMTSV